MEHRRVGSSALSSAVSHCATKLHQKLRNSSLTLTAPDWVCLSGTLGTHLISRSGNFNQIMTSKHAKFPIGKYGLQRR
jgi:hypothetical protein